MSARTVTIAMIATGEIDDVITVDGKNAAAVALGRRGARRGRRIYRPATVAKSLRKLPPPSGKTVRLSRGLAFSKPFFLTLFL
jgi:hypothetical protein